jgi:hypothetical protein
VKVFGLDGVARLSFFAFDPGFTGGVNVTAGDFEAPGRADIAVAPANGVGDLVRVFDGRDGHLVSAVAAFPVGQGSGVRLGAADLTGDGLDDLLFAGGPGASPQVRAVDGATGAVLADSTAFDPAFLGGVYVS